MKIVMELESTNVADLRAAHEVIAAQLRLLGAAISTGEQVSDVVAAIEAMWPDLGSRRLLWFAMNGWEPEHEFTLEDLARNMDLSLKAVRAVHRNLARTLKARGVDLNSVMPSRWDGKQKHYRLPAPIHESIRGLGQLSLAAG